MTVKTLAEFKKWLRMPGATLVLVDAGLHGDNWPKASLEAARKGRPVESVQSNAFTLKSGNPDRPNPSWMYFGKASNWQFRGDECSVGHEDGNILRYRLEIREPALA